MNTMKHLATATIIVLLFLVGCAQDYGYTESITTITQEINKTPKDLTAKAYGPALVLIRDSLSFEPERVTINKGQSVTWKVNGRVEELIRIEEVQGLFVSDQMRANDVFTFPFIEEGVYEISIINKRGIMIVEVVP